MDDKGALRKAADRYVAYVVGRGKGTPPYDKIFYSEWFTIARIAGFSRYDLPKKVDAKALMDDIFGRIRASNRLHDMAPKEEDFSQIARTIGPHSVDPEQYLDEMLVALEAAEMTR